MKKTHYLSFILLLLVNLSLVAQGKQNAIKKIKALKVNFITTELDLSPVEAKKFWPIYNAFEKSKRQIRIKALKEIRAKLSAYDGISKIPEKEAENIQFQYFDLEESLISSKRKHYQELIEAIGIHKVLKLHNAEKNFNNKLLKEYRKKRGHD